MQWMGPCRAFQKLNWAECMSPTPVCHRPSGKGGSGPLLPLRAQLGAETLSVSWCGHCQVSPG